MMKRIVATLFLLVLLLVALAVVAPGFIDWNKHKDIIISRLEAAIDRDIEVAGDVSFRILPNPQILLQDVSIASVKGAKNPHLLTLRQMEGKVRLKPLLEGRLEVESFHLTSPELTLEVLEDGQISWGVAGKQKQAGGSAFTAVELQNVSITDGKIRYLRHDNGADVVLDNLNVSLAAEQLQGPYVVKGDLRYHDIPVNIELATQVRNNTGLYPVKLLLQPVDVLPQIRFDGLMGLARGLVLDGDIDLEGGSLGSLFKDRFAQTAGFMQQAAKIKGALSFKDQKLDLTINEGTWDGKGKLEGNITAEFANVEKPRIAANLSGTTLALSAARGYLPVPDGYDISAQLKFLDVTWQGVRFPGLTLDVKTQNDEWIVADSRLDLNAKGGIQFSGTVTPKQEMATWNVVLNTPDAGIAFAHLKADAMPLLQALADKSLSIPLSLKGNLDQRKNRISLYNFTAKSGEDQTVSGVLNIHENGKLEAKLTIPKANLDRLPEAAQQKFMQQLPKQKLDAEITADEMAIANTVMTGVKLKATGDGQKLSIASFSGQTGEDAPFEVKGKLAAWPIGQGDFDLTYRLKTADAASFAEMLGAPMPSQLQNARSFDVTGIWKQDQVAQTLTAQGDYQGGILDMTAILPRGAENAAWKSDVDMTLPDSGLVFSTFGLPHDRLLLLAGTSAAFKGTVEGGRIQGNATTGKRKVAVNINMSADGSSTADVKTTYVDFNEWFADRPTAQADTDMTIDAQKIIWRDLAVEGVTADVVMKKSGFEARKLSGQLWGGALDVSATAKREAKTWQGRLTGTVKNADLAPLLTLTGIKGLSVGRGDVVFDLEGTGDTKGLKGTSGTISLTIDSVTLDAFDPAALAAFIRAEKSLPDDLGTRLHKAMRENGNSTFSDVSVDLKLTDGKAEIANLSLGNADVNVQVSGHFDTAAESYDIKAETILKSLPDVGSLSIIRKGAAADAPDYRFDIAGIKAWIESQMPAPVVEEAVPVVTDDLYAMPEAPTTDVEAVPLDVPPAFEDEVMPPADDSVEIEKLAPPEGETVETEGAHTDADTRDALQGILDRLSDDAPTTPEDEILPPE